MKDWCMKHPILTFLIIDQMLAMIENISIHYRRKKISTTCMFGEAIGNGIDGVIERHRSKNAEESKQPIGFAV